MYKWVKLSACIMFCTLFVNPAIANEDQTIVCHSKVQNFVQLSPELEKAANLKMPRNGPEAFIAFRLPLRLISIQKRRNSCRTEKLTQKFVLDKVKHGSGGLIELTLNAIVDGNAFTIRTEILGRNDHLGKQLENTIHGLSKYCGSSKTNSTVKYGLLHLPLTGSCGKAKTTFFGYPVSYQQRNNLKVGRIRCKKVRSFARGMCTMNMSYYDWPTKFSFPSYLLPKWKKVRQAAIDALDKKRVLLLTSSRCLGDLCDKLSAQ